MLFSNLQHLGSTANIHSSKDEILQLLRAQYTDMANLTDGWTNGRLPVCLMARPWSDRHAQAVSRPADSRATRRSVVPSCAAGKQQIMPARHARILLEADAAVRRRVRSDAQVAELCGVSPPHGGPGAGVLRHPMGLPRRCTAVPIPDRRPSSPRPRKRASSPWPAPPPPPGSRALECALAGRSRRRAGGDAARQPRTGAHHAQKNRLKPWRSKRWLIPP